MVVYAAEVECEVYAAEVECEVYAAEVECEVCFSVTNYRAPLTIRVLFSLHIDVLQSVK